MRGLPRNRLLWVAAVVLMAGLVWWGRGDLRRMLSLKPLPLGLCLVFTLGMALASVAKWRVCLRSMGEAGATRFTSLFHYFMLGRVLGLVVPMELGDFGARSMSLKLEHSISLDRGTYSVYLERAFDFAASGILVVPSALFITGVVGPGVGLAIGGIGFVAGLICFALFSKQALEFLGVLFRLLLSAVSRLPWIGRLVTAEADGKGLAVENLGAAAPKLYLLSGLKFLFTALRFASVALATGMAVGVADMVLFAPGAQLALLFSVTPGGLGVIDWSWSGLLYKIGVDRHDIVPYLITLRLSVLASVLVLAAVSRLLYRKPSQGEAQGRT
jgi:uncharacterized membrane protein YbhN (UPF0104 family)